MRKIILILYLNLNFQYIIFAGKIYTSEQYGDDEKGDGTDSKPFKTILHAMRFAGKEPFPPIYVDSKVEGEVTCIIIRQNSHIL